MASHKLAIVIPAYKARHLGTALECIKRQSDKRFTVYVGDDASPEPVAECVEKAGFDESQLKYTRFSDNMGGTSLIKQWDRCIALSDEPWVWLFSDDDEMDPDCVADFYRALEATDGRYDLYRFNSRVIDNESRCTAFCPPNPQWESARSYAYFFLRGVRRVTQQESIFSREAYQRIGGVPDLPLAWYSDSAFAIRCSQETGLYTMGPSMTSFRLSGENISSVADPKTVSKKWDALLQYVALLHKFTIETEGSDKEFTNPLLFDCIRELLFKGANTPRRWINAEYRKKFGETLQQYFPSTIARDSKRLKRANIKSVLHKLKLS